MINEKNFEEELEAIKGRNRRVELDKAWEVSWARRLFIAGMTYIVAAIWLVLIDDSLPWLKAFVPTGGYILSTFSLPALKRWWVRKR